MVTRLNTSDNSLMVRQLNGNSETLDRTSIIGINE